MLWIALLRGILLPIKEKYIATAKTKLDALRNAQLDMLKKNRIEHKGNGLPVTWGAFVLDGDWR